MIPNYRIQVQTWAVPNMNYIFHVYSFFEELRVACIFIHVYTHTNMGIMGRTIFLKCIHVQRFSGET
jgi:hypothetical protein